jgi:peptide/nickel transport system substrate-binding protein
MREEEVQMVVEQGTTARVGRGVIARSRSRRIAAGVASLGLVASVLAATAMAPAQAQDGEAEHISMAMPGNPPSLFIPRAWLVSTGTAMSLVQEGLLAFGNDLSLQPALAESWEAVDPTTYVYHLRPDLMFSDGSPVTADDVVFSMKLNMDPVVGSELLSFYASVESIEATAEDEITVKLTRPDAQFQYTPAHMAGFVLKQSQYEAGPDDIGTPGVLPIGTGPYKVTSFDPNASIELERNEFWRGPAPKVRTITLQLINDPQTALLAMQSGQINGAFEIALDTIDQWTQAGAQVETTPALSFFMLVMNTEMAPFDDIHARRAMWYAVDREGLVAAALGGRGQPANAINPPGMWAGVLTPEEVEEFYGTLTPGTFDLDMAREELAQSATPDGFTLDVMIQNSIAAMGPIAQSLVETLGQIGVTVNVTSVDSSVYYADYNSQASPFYIRSYAPDFADPANYPYLFLHSDSARQDGLNASLYRNPEFDALLDTAISSVDVAERAEAMKEALTIVDQDVPIAPIFWPDTAAAVTPDFQFNDFTAFYYNQPWALGVSAR